MTLARLPNRLATIATTRLPTLQTKAGSTKRIAGSSWMATRRRIMQRDGFSCACCGAIRMDHECDHVVPLEQGGSNDDDNLQLLCAWVDEHGVKRGCHAEKTRVSIHARHR